MKTLNNNYESRPDLECCNNCRFRQRHTVTYPGMLVQTTWTYTHWCWILDTDVSPTGICDKREARK